MTDYGTQAIFQIELRRDDGTRLKVIDSPVDFEYTRVVNAPGYFRVRLPQNFDRTLLAKDRRVLFWRKPPGGAMALEFAGLIRNLRTWADDDGNLAREIAGPDLNDLLNARVIAAYAGTSGADKTDYADDMLKSLVTQELGTSASASRQISSTYFSVAPDVSLGPTLTKAFSYRNLLDTLREIADASRNAGTELYFDIVPTGETTFQFQTFTTQRGMDRRASQPGGLTFALGVNLANPEITEDSSEEVNYAYGLGQGEGQLRNIQTASDATRTTASLFALREAAINASGETTSNGVTQAARGVVIAGRPRTLFRAKLLSVPGSIYGKDWGFGDRSTASFDGRQIEIMIRAVTVRVDGQGYEQIDSQAEAYV